MVVTPLAHVRRAGEHQRKAKWERPLAKALLAEGETQAAVRQNGELEIHREMFVGPELDNDATTLRAVDPGRIEPPLPTRL